MTIGILQTGRIAWIVFCYHWTCVCVCVLYGDGASEKSGTASFQADMLSSADS